MKVRVLFLVALMTAASCTTVRFVADYDKRTDDEITALQKKTDTFLNTMERTADSPEGAYERHAHLYDAMRADVNVLIVRSEALAMNYLTTAQLMLLQETLASLEEQHKKGLKKIMIGPVRQGLNAHYSAILKLEVAKKEKDR